MKLFDIVTHPSDILRTTAEKVPEVNDEIREIMDTMLETMYVHDGIGLAAPQVGINKTIVVMNVDRLHDGHPYKMVNPVIVKQSDKIYTGIEGCLSVKDKRGNIAYHDVTRPVACKVSYLNYDGEEDELYFYGLAAKCIQHEIDHLNGVLFFDYLNKKDSKRFMKQLGKKNVK